MEIKAKKSLGQHWLKSKSALTAIIKSADLKSGEVVLEIGPGQGVLTESLLDTGARVIAIEKDENLAFFLTKKFADQIKSHQLKIVVGDVLDLEIKQILNNEPYKIVANIPYYLTGQFFRQFLSATNQPTSIIVLIQKEVANRIVAKNKKESILSISVKAYGKPRLEKIVPAGAFSPPPKVDSAILSIKNISRDFFTGIDEAKFFTLVKKGFGQKRKQLKNNLGLEQEILNHCKLPSAVRAEDLNLVDWHCLASTRLSLVEELKK